MRTWALGLALLGLVACGPAAAPGPATAAATPADALDLKPYAGAYYADFVSAPHMERFAPENLGLDGEALARFQNAMQVQSPAPLAAGGGSQALVFQGCRAHACPEAVAVLAVDAATGSVFVGVRDEKGQTVLKGDDRLEALLDATSPTQRWSDPVSWEGPPPAPAP
ncbi:MAG TPA: hypothetical protein VG841_14295 [Caulobacterales bacterium]|nr:hypothetical protein [Caulobacterales bacterium]